MINITIPKISNLEYSIEKAMINLSLIKKFWYKHASLANNENLDDSGFLEAGVQTRLGQILDPRIRLKIII